MNEQYHYYASDEIDINDTHSKKYQWHSYVTFYCRIKDTLLYYCCVLFLLSVVDAFDPDLVKYPLFKKAVSILVEQLPGEMLIIPSGWFHQVGVMQLYLKEIQ